VRGVEARPCVYLGRVLVQSEAQPVQRSRGRTEPGVLEEQQGDTVRF
jgi:hypothetical protein